jgi:hypothetical protein
MTAKKDIVAKEGFAPIGPHVHWGPIFGAGAFADQTFQRQIANPAQKLVDILCKRSRMPDIRGRSKLIREKRLSPRRGPRRPLLPLSPKRTQVRLRSLLNLVWLAPDSLQTHGRPSGKSAVYGLNGLRPTLRVGAPI